MDENSLAELFVANDDFTELEEALDVFCPFESVGMVNQEIRHGHFLSYIFDPNRPHGFGQAGLKALMSAAARSQEQLASDLSLMDVHLMDFQNSSVRREWNKIDILIEAPDHNLVIAIELKIDAKEHSGQLSRYRAAVAAEWPGHRHIFLFLTKHGDDPSDDGEGWQSIELDQLAQELSLVAKRSTGHPSAKIMLESYLTMLGRHHLNDERLEEIAARLWSRHKEALEFLADRRPNAVGELFQRIVNAQDYLAEQISVQTGQSVCVDYSRPAAVYFAVPDWDKIPGFLCSEGFTPSKRILLLEVAKAKMGGLRCYFILGRGNQQMRESLFSTLRDGDADTGKRKQLTAEWNRLASRSIPLKDLDENSDFDAVAGRVISQIRGFAADHIPIYTKALEKLIQS